MIKAIIIGEKLGMLTLGDDTGLCIDALDGRPGIHSARYSEGRTYASNNEKVLQEMENVPEEKRGCHYHCSVAIYDPKTKFVETTEGRLDGRITFELRGSNSFGYAPITEVENSQKTYAEYEHNALLKINHRGNAFRAAIQVLDEYFLK